MAGSGAKTGYVALLRGINLGARNRVPMARLRELCGEEGAEEVRTYIASGNVLLTSSDPANVLASRLEKAIERDFGHNVSVIVLTQAEMEKVVKKNPFRDAAPGTVHVAFAAKAFDTDAAARLQKLDNPPEELKVVGAMIYFHLPNGYGRASLPTEIDRIVGKVTTVRNWRTVETLNKMAIGRGQ